MITSTILAVLAATAVALGVAIRWCNRFREEAAGGDDEIAPRPPEHRTDTTPRH